MNGKTIEVRKRKQPIIENELFKKCFLAFNLLILISKQTKLGSVFCAFMLSRLGME
jgi:hypothetical protein